MTVRRMFRSCLLVLGAAGLIGATPLAPAVASPPEEMRLTSITIDPEDASGKTTNAPGAWSTNTGDPLCPVSVWDKHGLLLNNQGGSGDLGEISIPLKSGLTTLTLRGDGVFPDNKYYGGVLFFNGRATPPQVAVYNANGEAGDFQVQSDGTVIMGGANGGLFFDSAPGTSVYRSEGFQVSVEKFVVNASGGAGDQVSCGGIGANGVPDMVATLALQVTPKK